MYACKIQRSFNETIMKRRNVDSTKHRKQFHVKKCKFTDGMYGRNFKIYYSEPIIPDLDFFLGLLNKSVYNNLNF
ncbi:hypothetical protein BpHYR1_010989 [Brachionus plicatilis]|uniref:Uncharacterized protein n=1 Tax=Brachionus plicatilis TaxID=10195 RepID=A0A3M7T1K3_BRAPC|nr:hypothetical protein BpHYR1_010989 [Brachionus plicatilis]